MRDRSSGPSSEYLMKLRNISEIIPVTAMKSFVVLSSKNYSI